MRRPESHFRSNQRIRSGIFYFLCLMLLLEGVRYATVRYPAGRPANAGPLPLSEAGGDSVPSVKPPGARSHPFRSDPNHLDDFGGYRLGIPPDALDSLYAYRRSGKRMYSIDDFREVTGLPDSAIRRLSRLLRFPGLPKPRTRPAREARIRDLNTATAAELQAIHGVGPVLSARIVKFRDALGGFLVDEQVRDVYGLPPEVAGRLMQYFRVMDPPDIPKINLNQASVQELAGLVYITWEMARDLVARRERFGPYKSLSELTEVRSIPEDRIERIALYLSL